MALLGRLERPDQGKARAIQRNTLNYLIHAPLTFVWFLAINLAMSAAVGWIARRDLPSESPAFWFAIRLLPAVSALVFVVAVFMPSYWRYEPRDTTEGFDVTLTALAIVALAILGRYVEMRSAHLGAKFRAAGLSSSGNKPNDPLAETGYRPREAAASAYPSGEIALAFGRVLG